MIPATAARALAILFALTAFAQTRTARATFRGTWKITEIVVPAAPAGKVKRADLPDGMPGAGSTVQFSAKQMCVVSPPDEKVCHDVKTEAKTLADIPGGAMQAELLKVSPATRYVTVFLDGQADFGFVVMPDRRMLADFPICPGGACTTAFEVWAPADSAAGVAFSK